MCCSSLFVVTNALRLTEKAKGNRVKANKRLKTIKVVVEGMHCKHCQSKVYNALSAIDGVYKVEVDLKTKTATLEIQSSVTDKLIEEVISSVGFVVNEIKR